uniref:Lipoprotein n=1 Tax=Panagrellus redivivus TaxID=6233 RepID=A0A7E4UQX1_PANRE
MAHTKGRLPCPDFPKGHSRAQQVSRARQSDKSIGFMKPAAVLPFGGFLTVLALVALNGCLPVEDCAVIAGIDEGRRLWSWLRHDGSAECNCWRRD